MLQIAAVLTIFSATTVALPFINRDKTSLHIDKKESPSATKDFIELSSEQIKALRSGTKAIIESRHNVDEKPLYQVFTGKALDSQINVVQALKEDKQYAIWMLYNQDIGQPIEVDSSTAKVPLVITWSASIYSSATKQCVGQFARYESPQTVKLIKEEKSNEWKIDEISFEKGNPPFKDCN
jgi:hypothetical protein